MNVGQGEDCGFSPVPADEQCLLIHSPSNERAESCCEESRRYVKQALEAPDDSTVGCVAEYAILFLIGFSTLCVVLETEQNLPIPRPFFRITETVVTALFTLEIFVRNWCQDERCAYFFSCSNCIDILATLPWYVEQAMQMAHINTSLAQAQRTEEVSNSFKALRMVKMIRLMRMIRLAKAAKHSEVITTFVSSVTEATHGLMLLVAFLGMGALFSATVVFFIESDEPETLFTSIPVAMWWAMSTMTSVGYGDMVPTTTAGKITGVCTMVAGVLVISVSGAVVTSAFIRHFDKKMQKAQRDKEKRKTSVSTARFQSGPQGDGYAPRERAICHTQWRKGTGLHASTSAPSLAVLAVDDGEKSDTSLDAVTNAQSPQSLPVDNRRVSTVSNAYRGRRSLSIVEGEPHELTEELEQLRESLDNVLHQLDDLADEAERGRDSSMRSSWSRGKSSRPAFLKSVVQGLRGQSGALFEVAIELSEQLAAQRLEAEELDLHDRKEASLRASSIYIN